MNIYDIKGAELHQYKNAFHFGYIANNTHHSRDKAAEQGRLNFNQHVPTKHTFFHPYHKDRNQFDNGNGSHQTLQGIGITIDDVGHLLIAEWKNNKIEGMYFLFKSNIVEEFNQTMACFGICQYGCIRQGFLEGDNYMYNISGSIIKGRFLRNKLIDQCYIVHNNRAFVSQLLKDQQQKLVECEVIDFNSKYQKGSVTPENGGNKQRKQIPNFESFSPFNKERQNNKQVNYEMIDATIFAKPLQFLDKMTNISHKGEEQQTLKRSQLCKLELNEHEVFFGFLENARENASKKKGNINALSKMNGFGLVFRDGWPFKYGHFQKGNLEGLGRIYETQMTICDGLFQKNKMMEGFIIDYYNNQLSFGYNSLIKHQSPSETEQQFIVTHNYSCSQLQIISEFKKQHHLKSLKFKNNYFASPRLFFHSPWPVSLIGKLYEKSQIENIIKNFNPAMREFDLSEIQKEGQSSENRVERLIVNQLQDKKAKQNQEKVKQLNLRKSHIIDAQITNYLKSKDNTVTIHDNPRVINGYLKEYEHIVRSQHKQKSNSFDKAHKRDNRSFQAQNQRYNNKPYLETDRLPTNRKEEFSYASPHQVSMHQPQNIGPFQFSRTGTNPKDLTELIKEYQICETQRKNALSYYTPSKNNTDRKSASRNIQSKRYLIQQDHVEQRLNTTERRKPSRSRSTRRTQIDLHRIYNKYLKS